jgi:hypothetical protein
MANAPLVGGAVPMNVIRSATQPATKEDAQ